MSLKLVLLIISATCGLSNAHNLNNDGLENAWNTFVKSSGNVEQFLSSILSLGIVGFKNLNDVPGSLDLMDSHLTNKSNCYAKLSTLIQTLGEKFGNVKSLVGVPHGLLTDASKAAVRADKSLLNVVKYLNIWKRNFRHYRRPNLETMIIPQSILEGIINGAEKYISSVNKIASDFKKFGKAFSNVTGSAVDAKLPNSKFPGNVPHVLHTIVKLLKELSGQVNSMITHEYTYAHVPDTSSDRFVIIDLKNFMGNQYSIYKNSANIYGKIAKSFFSGLPKVKRIHRCVLKHKQ